MAKIVRTCVHHTVHVYTRVRIKRNVPPFGVSGAGNPKGDRATKKKKNVTYHTP